MKYKTYKGENGMQFTLTPAHQRMANQLRRGGIKQNTVPGLTDFALDKATEWRQRSMGGESFDEISQKKPNTKKQSGSDRIQRRTVEAVERAIQKEMREGRKKFNIDGGRNIRLTRNSILFQVRTSLEPLVKKLEKRAGISRVDERMRGMMKELADRITTAIGFFESEYEAYTEEIYQDLMKEYSDQLRTAMAEAMEIVGLIEPEDAYKIADDVIVALIEGRLTKSTMDTFVFRRVETYAQMRVAE